MRYGWNNVGKVLGNLFNFPNQYGCDYTVALNDLLRRGCEVVTIDWQAKSAVLTIRGETQAGFRKNGMTQEANNAAARTSKPLPTISPLKGGGGVTLERSVSMRTN
jgi:hypothetical protein